MTKLKRFASIKDSENIYSVKTKGDKLMLTPLAINIILKIAGVFLCGAGGSLIGASWMVTNAAHKSIKNVYLFLGIVTLAVGAVVGFFA